MKRGILVYNPAAGGSVAAAHMHAVVTRAASLGVTLEERPTSAPGDCARLVHEAVATSPDLVAVAGGDGTISEAAAALVNTRVPLAILSFGTANVLAREYGIGTDARRAEQVLASPRTRPITAWRSDRRTFVMWVGVGFDARMMRTAHAGLKRALGRVGIGWSGLTQFLLYDFPKLTVEGVDENGRTFSHECTYAIAANIQRYGGDMKLAPLADPEDDLLDLVLFTGRTHAELALFLVTIGTGAAGRSDPPTVRRVRARTATIRADRLEPVLVDGDVAGYTPIQLGPTAGRIQILVP